MNEAYWAFQDATGVERIGTYEDCSDFGGSDIVYHMRIYAPGTHQHGRPVCLSGSRLKNARRISPPKEETDG